MVHWLILSEMEQKFNFSNRVTLHFFLIISFLLSVSYSRLESFLEFRFFIFGLRKLVDCCRLLQWNCQLWKMFIVSSTKTLLLHKILFSEGFRQIRHGLLFILRKFWMPNLSGKENKIIILFGINS